MENIGKKIKSIRTSKVFSQEELASKSTINVRTIQRIESGKNMPHGKTLQLICDVLEVQANEIIEFHLKENHTTMMWLYLSICSVVVLPFGNLFIPLIIWLNNKERIKKLNNVGKNVVYNQIVFTVCFYLLFGFFAFQKITHKGYIKYQTALLILLSLVIINFGFAIYAGIMANKGKYMKYPFFRK